MRKNSRVRRFFVIVMAMRILIIGAGSVGGYFGGKLAKAGHETWFIARGAHLDAIRQNGLRVKSIQGDFTVHPHAADQFPPIPDIDIILVCVKHKDTPSILPHLKKHLGQNTVVISLQNGVDGEKELSSAIPLNNIVGGIAYIGSELASPGLIKHTASGLITIGELTGKTSGRVDAIKSLFETASVKCRISNDIVKDKWEKLIWNVGFNGLCAITRLPARPLLSHPPTREIVKGLMMEMIAVAHKSGIAVDASLADRYIDNTLKGGEVVPSTLQDILHGKMTEIDILNGKVSVEGKKLGVPTPLNDLVWAAVSAIDSARSGQPISC